MKIYHLNLSKQLHLKIYHHQQQQQQQQHQWKNHYRQLHRKGNQKMNLMMNGTHGHNYSNHFVLFCIYIYEHFCTNNTNKKNDFRFIKVKKKTILRI
jgi:hypothetical protein